VQAIFRWFLRLARAANNCGEYLGCPRRLIRRQLSKNARQFAVGSAEVAVVDCCQQQLDHVARVVNGSHLQERLAPRAQEVPRGLGQQFANPAAVVGNISSQRPHGPIGELAAPSQHLDPYPGCIEYGEPGGVAAQCLPESEVQRRLLVAGERR
jgi:hypothetical protein